MSPSELLQNELTLATRRLQTALSLERKLTRIARNRRDSQRHLPSPEECRLLVKLRATEYALLLTRYRESVERTLLGKRPPRIGPSIRKRMEFRASGILKEPDTGRISVRYRRS